MRLFRTSPFSDSEDIISAWLFWTLVIALGSVRFLNLGFQSPWIDEISTLYDANPNLHFSDLFYNITNSQVHPPIYFILIHYFFKLFGYSVEVLRFFSGFFGLLSIGMFYVLLKDYFDKATGQIGSLLLSINGAFFWFSQEGRSYTFFIFICIFSYWTILKWHKERKFKWILGTFISNVFLIYTNYFGIFAVFSQGSAVILYFFFTKDKNTSLRLVYLYAFTGICFAPWLPFTEQGTKFVDSWIKTPEIFSMVHTAVNFLFPNFILKVSYLVFIGISTLIGFRNGKKFEIFILHTWILLFIVSSYLFSLFVTPILAWKYFIFILIPVISVVSFGIRIIAYPYFRYALLLLFMCISGWLTFWKFSPYFGPIKSEYFPFTQFIKSADCQLPVLVYEYKPIKWCFDYFDVQETLLQTDSLLNEQNLQKNPLSQGWWELHLHRPFFTDSIRSAFFKTEDLVHFSYNNFSTLDLWVPHERTIPILAKATDSHHIRYTLGETSGSRLKIIFSIQSSQRFFSDSRVRLQLNGQIRSFRIRQPKGIYSATFEPCGDKASLVISTENRSVLPALKVEDILILKDDTK